MKVVFFDLLIGRRHIYSIYTYARSIQLLFTHQILQPSTGEKKIHIVYVASAIIIQCIFGVTMVLYFILVCYKLNRFLNPWVEPVLYICTVSL